MWSLRPAYLQWRLIHEQDEHNGMTNLADVMRLHRQEHTVGLLIAACQELRQKAIEPVLERLLRLSPNVGRLERPAMTVAAICPGAGQRVCRQYRTVPTGTVKKVISRAFVQNLPMSSGYHKWQ